MVDAAKGDTEESLTNVEQFSRVVQEVNAEIHRMEHHSNGDLNRDTEDLNSMTLYKAHHSIGPQIPSV